ncbi:flagellar export chaperone FlgN [Mitsuaria sp. GD03876]|uniref:flagellar export chaperone FlgN n=1 Tax=Mitsuaria sp. GD03876 TaxID=2975399 RepID=UPI002449D748|nr:flagellar export chaperone FlgN [Mitsuaria sp. GD03876]MDH0868349.1 flagellar protein FlgN [Mitsuaria sp. GD03876]
MTATLTRTARRADSTAATMLRQLREGLAQDLRGYGALRELLERQFHAALRHQSEEMAALSAGILAQAAEIEAQRAHRRELLVALLGRAGQPSLRALLDRLPVEMGEPLLALRQAIERALAECKAMNLRNAQLIGEQQALMQQLLGREEHVYAQR